MRAVLAVLAAAVCFGTTGTAQALGPEADPLSLGAARILIGGGALALIALVLARRRPRDHDALVPEMPVLDGAPTGSAPTTDARRARLVSAAIVVAGAIGVLAYQPAFFAGTERNGVAVGTVVALGSAPVLTGLLEWAFRGHRPSGHWALSTVVATAGIATLGLASGDAEHAIDPLGLAASLGAGLSYAVYALASKGLLERNWSGSGAMGAIFGSAAVVSLPLLLATDASWLATPDGLVMGLWLGLVTTTLAYLLFAAGLRHLTAATVSTLTLAEPLTATLLGLFVLGERLPVGAAIGLAVLAAGLTILALPVRRRAVRPPAPR
ncbi:DMT family transporter [Agromyces mangrovi Wang et al. 2018]|uniref:DMT family transporter n=1 Tax=Agromyces mangrovi TaxID=1858653 RepID=UPI002572828C|nr:EamA family transporter [Agromyces mangrovi]BDZ63984.1 transporter [Agromyces mangrovi]